MDRINHPTAVDIGGGRRGFQSKDTAAGIPGTVCTAGHLNASQEEMLAIIEKSGVVASAAEQTQLIRAIRSQAVNFRQAGGPANALTIALDPAPTSNAQLAWTPLRIRTPLSNTGSVTLSANGLEALPVVRPDGMPLERGDLLAGGIVSVIATGGAYMLLGVAYSEFRKRLTGTLTVYVRPDGNDANDGWANNSAAAFRTIQGALDRVRTLYDPVGFTVVIKLGVPGTYLGNIAAPDLGSPIVIEGDTANQASYVISGPGAQNGGVVGLAGGEVTLRGVTLLNTGNVSQTLNAAAGARVLLLAATFQASVPYSGFAHMSAGLGGSITIDHGCRVESDMSYTFLAAWLGNIVGLPGVGFTFAGGRSMYVATAAAMNGSIIFSPSFGFVGAVTGKRYDASANGIIMVSGAGPNFIPGSLAGTTSSGGQYV